MSRPFDFAPEGAPPKVTALLSFRAKRSAVEESRRFMMQAIRNPQMFPCRINRRFAPAVRSQVFQRWMSRNVEMFRLRRSSTGSAQHDSFAVIRDGFLRKPGSSSLRSSPVCVGTGASTPRRYRCRP